MAPHNLQLHYFDTAEKAAEFKTEKPGEILPMPDANILKYQKPVVVATYTPPLGRFRLLDEEPFIKLLQEEFVSDWVRAISNSPDTATISIHTISYDKTSGKPERGSEGHAVIRRTFGIKQREDACPVGGFVRRKLDSCSVPNISAASPCLNCDRYVVDKVNKFVSIRKRDPRLLAFNLTRPVSTEELPELTRTCWAGLTCFGLPLLV